MDDIGAMPMMVPCYSFGRWRGWRQLGQTVHTFLSHNAVLRRMIALRWRPLKAPVNWQTLVRVLSQIGSSPLIVVTQLQHVHFPPSVNLAFAPMPFVKPIAQPYYGVHWRRGDFRGACLNKDPQACFPEPSALRELLLLDPSVATVYLASDDPDAIRIFQSMYPSLTFIAGTSVCAQRYFEDMAALVHSTHFIGNRYSTLSRLVIAQRNQSGSPSAVFR